MWACCGKSSKICEVSLWSLVVVILGLGHAFSLAAHNRDTWNQLQRVYRMSIMGDFEVDDYHVDGSDLEQHHMLYLFFILITVSHHHLHAELTHCCNL